MTICEFEFKSVDDGATHMKKALITTKYKIYHPNVSIINSAASPSRIVGPFGESGDFGITVSVGRL